MAIRNRERYVALSRQCMNGRNFLKGNDNRGDGNGG